MLTDLLLDPVSGYNGRRGEIDRRAQVLGTRLHGIELFALSETVNELQNFPEILGTKSWSIRDQPRRKHCLLAGSSESEHRCRGLLAVGRRENGQVGR